MSGNPFPLIILMEPQMGENIGMCARAMLNCGLDRLRLVRPRDGWPNPAAKATAADADLVLENTEVFDSLEAAIADCHHVFAASTRPRSLPVPFVSSDLAVRETIARSRAGAQVAILFGSEASGLDNASVARANLLFHFATDPSFPSLNLAQSVLLFGWDWRAESQRDSTVPQQGDKPAPGKDLISFLDRLEQALDSRGFFPSPDLRATTENRLRGLFSRTAPTDRELALLQGMLSALLRSPSEESSEL